MSRLAFGDPAALVDRVYAYVAYRIGPGAAAEDVTSETIERALRYDTYDPDKGDPAAWLVGIARRRIAELAARPQAVALEEAPEEGDDFRDRSLLRLSLAEAVSGLAERERELVALRYGADLTSREIGRVLGMTPGAVDVALHRLLGRLRAALEDEPVRTSRLER